MTDFKLLQLANAFFPIFLMFLPIVTLVILLPEHALPAIEVTIYFLPETVIASGITTLFFDVRTFLSWAISEDVILYTRFFFSTVEPVLTDFFSLPGDIPGTAGADVVDVGRTPSGEAEGTPDGSGVTTGRDLSPVRTYTAPAVVKNSSVSPDASVFTYCLFVSSYT